MKIVFFGTSPFAASVLDFLLKEGSNVVAVVTRPDRPKGRSKKLSPSPVKQKLLDIGCTLPIHTPEKASTDAFAEVLSSYDPDLFLVVAYGEIIKQNLLDLPKKGCINIHASLLPKYRGAAPMQRALMAGEKETGITIIDMVLKMDAGPMLHKEICPIDDTLTLGELDQKLLLCACAAVKKVLPNIAQGTVQKEIQDETAVTFAKKITPEETKIDWTRPAHELHNHIRSLSPRPGAWTNITIAGTPKRLKILRTCVVKNKTAAPGELVIACGQDALSILEVQLEGKRAMSVTQFLNGNSNIAF